MVDEFTSGERPTAEKLNRAVLKCVARGNRNTAKGTFTTTETAALRIDNVPVEAGRLYRIEMPGWRADSTVNTDVNKFYLRYSTTSPATTSSTLLATNEMNDQMSTMVVGFVTPGSDSTTYSFIGSCARIGGSGNVTLQADGGGYSIVVYDCGIDPGDTGIDL